MKKRLTSIENLQPARYNPRNIDAQAFLGLSNSPDQPPVDEYRLLLEELRGLELDEAYCDVVVERWEALTGGKAKRKKA